MIGADGVPLEVGTRVRIPGSVRPEHFGRVSFIRERDDGRSPCVVVLFDDGIVDFFLSCRTRRQPDTYTCMDIEAVAETLAERLDG